MPEQDAYAFLQGEGSLAERIRNEDMIRRNQKPKVPPEPTLATSAFTLSDGSTAAAVTATWAPIRKDINYIVRWKKSTDGDYTYERTKTSPHVIRPVETGVTIQVGLAAERRQYNTRSEFTTNTSIATAGDATTPSAITLSIQVNQSNGTIHLTWTTATEADVIGYILYRDTSAGATTEYARIGSTIFTDFGVTIGTTYFYRVKAVDRTGNTSAFSNEVSGTVAYVGVITASPTVSCITDPTASYTTAITQQITIPVGTRFMQLAVQANAVSIIGGSGTVGLRFSVGSAGVDTSNTTTLTFSSVSAQTAVLKSLAPVSVSGVQNILYEWLDAEGDASSFQMTSAGSIQCTTS